MPRHPKVLAERTFCHVFNHVNREDSPFLDLHEAESFVARVREARARDGFAVFAWCLMPNHFHLVVRTGQVPLWSSLLLVQQRDESNMDDVEGGDGSPWPVGCGVREISRRVALDRTVAYVHLNPVTAGLADDPASYRWSGHRELLGLEAPGVVDVELALARFGPTPEEARDAYLALLRRERSNPRLSARPGPGAPRHRASRCRVGGPIWPGASVTEGPHVGATRPPDRLETRRRLAATGGRGRPV
jgi:putative transposase